MAELPILTHPAPELRRKARKVTDFGSEFQALVEDMIATMRAAPGVGLAATQVDKPVQLIVVEYGDEQDEEAPTRLYVVVNPELTRLSSETEVGTEGCLSVPGFVGDVERPVSTVVKGLNRYGKPTKIKAEGWLARIFQHEVDHLNGVLFIDRAEKVYRLEEDEMAEAVAAD